MSAQSAEWIRFQAQVSETTFFSAGRGRRLQCETGSQGEREVQSGASIRFEMDFFPVRMTDSERAGGEEWSEPQKRGKRVARKR